MFHLMPSTKIAQNGIAPPNPITVELKVENNLYTKSPELFAQFQNNFTHKDLYQNCPNCFTPRKKMAIRAKHRKQHLSYITS